MFVMACTNKALHFSFGTCGRGRAINKECHSGRLSYTNFAKRAEDDPRVRIRQKRLKQVSLHRGDNGTRSSLVLHQASGFYLAELEAWKMENASEMDDE